MSRQLSPTVLLAAVCAGMPAIRRTGWSSSTVYTMLAAIAVRCASNPNMLCHAPMREPAADCRVSEETAALAAARLEEIGVIAQARPAAGQRPAVRRVSPSWLLRAESALAAVEADVADQNVLPAAP